MQGLIGKKIGMTRVFDAQGQQVSVTAIECGPCVVVQRRTKATDGYDAIQLGFGDLRVQRSNKAECGIYKKANTTPKQHRREFGLDAGEDVQVGQTLTVGDVFKDGGFVDIVGVTKGKGFQGVMRRHNMSGGPMTHGGHSKRRIGSIGCRELPGRIHKNKRMPGHMGNVRITMPNLKVIQVLLQDNVILVRGAVPGHAGALVMVKKSLKKGSSK